MRFKGIRLGAVSENLITVDSLKSLVEGRVIDPDVFYSTVEDVQLRERLKRKHKELNAERNRCFTVPDPQIKKCKMSGVLTSQNDRLKKLRFHFRKRRLHDNFTTTPFGYLLK